jgi:hypothetical protein
MTGEQKFQNTFQLIKRMLVLSIKFECLPSIAPILINHEIYFNI